jgi:hypothetical protein
MSKVVNTVKAKATGVKEKVMKNKKSIGKKALIIGAVGAAALVAVKKFRDRNDEDDIDWSDNSYCVLRRFDNEEDTTETDSSTTEESVEQ